MNEMHDDRFLELAALHAIGALPEPECAAVRAHLMTCERCREEYAAARSAATALLLAQDAPAPAALRARVLGAIAPRSNVVPLWRRSAVWMAAAAAIVVLVIVGRQFVQRPAQSWLASCTTTAVCVSARVVAVDDRTLRLEADGMAPAPNGKTYQAWIIPKGGKPIPEPVFNAAGGRAAVAIPAAAQPGTVVAVTVEPIGGSTAPTTKPFLIIKID